MDTTSAKEGVKTTTRHGLIGVISVVVTYLVGLALPDAPTEVSFAIIYLIGVFVDNFNHVRGSKLKIPV
jgi:hypothetical protein